jgi:hypothetical protein
VIPAKTCFMKKWAEYLQCHSGNAWFIGLVFCELRRYNFTEFIFVKIQAWG